MESERLVKDWGQTNEFKGVKDWGHTNEFNTNELKSKLNGQNGKLPDSELLLG